MVELIILNRKEQIMPGYDKTGPAGEGPRTGRGLGNCPPEEGEKKTPGTTPRKAPGLGLGRGAGRGAGRGFRRAR